MACHAKFIYSTVGPQLQNFVKLKVDFLPSSGPGKAKFADFWELIS